MAVEPTQNTARSPRKSRTALGFMTLRANRVPYPAPPVDDLHMRSPWPRCMALPDGCRFQLGKTTSTHRIDEVRQFMRYL